MRRFLALSAVTTFALLLAGCGQAPESDTTEEVSQKAAAAHAAMPADEDHKGMSAHGATGGSMALNTEMTLDESIRAAWSGVRVRVEDVEAEISHTFDIALGDELALGDSGLTLTALDFVPDFVMGEDGITSRSAEPANPAARVTILEDGQEPYTGWLFAAMPKIHPFPHERYRVLLVEGLPN
jgi:hypothetical protein